MTRSDFERLHALLDQYEDAAMGSSTVSEDEYESALGNLREAIVRHVQQVEGQARRNARRSA